MRRTFIYDKQLKRVIEIGEAPKDYESLAGRPFEPHYDSVLRSWVTSESDKAKKMKKLKNYSHPQGLYNVRDDKKFMKEMQYIQKNREMYKEATHPGYKARTEREIEKYGTKAWTPEKPDIDRFSARHR